MSKAITTESGRGSGDDGWRPGQELAPSLMAKDEPTFARIVGMISAALVIFGGAILVLARTGRATAVGPGWASLWLTLGLAGLLFHAAYDSDIQFRRLYMGFGVLALVLGCFFCVLPYPTKVGDQFALGVSCLLLSLCFLLAFLRHEDDRGLRDMVQFGLGLVGAVFALVGFVGSNVNVNFLAPYGTVLPLLGLAFLSAFIGTRGTADDLAYITGRAMGWLGALLFLVALVRSFAGGINFFVPSGVLLIFFGLLYVIASLLICSDGPIAVMTRRELGSFFYSPIAYIVLFAFTIAHWLAYAMYVSQLLDPRGGPAIEPIVSGFILQWTAIFLVMFVVPALTMRLLAEEQKAGTLEVLLTCPVNEGSVVFSKFFAALIMYLIIWMPFALFLIAFRLLGGTPFDYRPLLSFFVGLVITGAGFVSVGVLFSSMTKNQITSGVLTFCVMLTLTLVFLFKAIFFRTGGGESAWEVVLKHISYIDVWIDTLDGKLTLKFLLFPASLTIFCLFLTVKVLEARKWK
jgi:ABC-type transport system involved in multi-copper enzyme maturation permease subunit